MPLPTTNALAAKHRALALAAGVVILAGLVVLALLARGLVPLGAASVAALALALLVVPSLAGWRARALRDAAWTTGGPRAPMPRPAPLDLLEGYALLVAITRLRAPTVRLDVPLADLQVALLDAGAACEPRGKSALDVTLPEDGGRVAIKSVPLAFPRGARGLRVRGESAGVRRASLLLESLAVGRFSWSEAGRRFEARLHAMMLDAAKAGTLEERSLLAEDAQRLERLLDARAGLPQDEWLALRAWKTQRVRLQLANKLLSEPAGPRAEGRVVAPAPALAPALPHVLDAGGGLASLRRVVFVPHWIVPVRDARHGGGEREVLVNALTHKPDLERGDEVLDAARERAPRFLLDAPRSVTFLPAPEPTAALLRELRDALPHADVASAVASPPEWLLVPFIPTSDGAYVNAVTGAKAPDLGPVASLAMRA